MANEGIYLFLQNVQIATMIVSFVCFALGIVALIFFIGMMFYGIKVAKIYIKAHEADAKAGTTVAENESNLDKGACENCMQKEESEALDTKEE